MCTHARVLWRVVGVRGLGFSVLTDKGEAGQEGGFWIIAVSPGSLFFWGLQLPDYYSGPRQRQLHGDGGC